MMQRERKIVKSIVAVLITFLVIGGLFNKAYADPVVEDEKVEYESSYAINIDSEAENEEYAINRELPVDDLKTAEVRYVPYESLVIYEEDDILGGYDAEVEYWKKFSNRYYYEKLSAKEKELWDGLDSVCMAILSGRIELEDGFFPSVKCDISLVEGNKIRNIMEWFVYSNPQYYFLNSGAGYGWSEGSRVAYVSIDVIEDFRDIDTLKKSNRIFKEKVESYLSQINVNSLKYPEKIEKKIHDLICQKVKYKKCDLDQSVWSAIVLGETVCAGYTKAMNLLGNACGLDVIPVLGVAGYPGCKGNHAWNMINLYENWYLVDSTWDDTDSSNSSQIYEYYNIGEDSMHDPGDGRGCCGNYSSYIPKYPYDSTRRFMYDGTYVDPMIKAGDYLYFSVCDESSKKLLQVVEGYNKNRSIFDAPDKVTLNVNVGSVGYIKEDVVYTVIPWNKYTNGKQVTQFVDRLYNIILNRKAEIVGLDDWACKLLSGKVSSAELVQGIVCSQEYLNRNLNANDSVEKLYQAMLGRNSDPTGKSDWVEKLNNGMTFSAIVNGFSGSTEFGNICDSYGIKPGSISLGENRDQNALITAFASRCYTKALNRSFDIDGLNHWSGELLSKRMSAESVAHGFVFSTEFINRNLSNEEFVDTMYALCFGRGADNEGKNDWLRRMSSGASREDVFMGFAKSQEFANLVASFGL